MFVPVVPRAEIGHHQPRETQEEKEKEKEEDAGSGDGAKHYCKANKKSHWRGRVNKHLNVWMFFSISGTKSPGSHYLDASWSTGSTTSLAPEVAKLQLQSN